MSKPLFRVVPVLTLLTLGPTAVARVQAVGPTDIVAVDEFIDAPRTLFGRTAGAVRRALGAPTLVGVRSMPAARTGHLEGVLELTYPGVVFAVDAGPGALRRVEVTEARWALPRGLNVGVSRRRVEDVLGEPQLTTDVSALYLYSDAYPDTVEFFYRDGRVQRIEWLYAPTR